jgi:hypothetical protein
LIDGGAHPLLMESARELIAPGLSRTNDQLYKTNTQLEELTAVRVSLSVASVLSAVSSPASEPKWQSLAINGARALSRLNSEHTFGRHGFIPQVDHSLPFVLRLLKKTPWFS